MDDQRSRFEAEVLPHLNTVYRFARWLTRTPGDADDLVQESFLRAFRGFDRLRGSNVKAWLFAIVRNCHATAQQQRRKRGFVPLPAENDTQDGHAMVATTGSPETASMEWDEGCMLERLIAALPAEQRETLLLKEVEDLSYREIARITNVPIGTVMSRLARARSALRMRWPREVKGESRGLR
jgi:RNA polymerase sigma-70 factor (ECF subfamily)